MGDWRARALQTLQRFFTENTGFVIGVSLLAITIADIVVSATANTLAVIQSAGISGLICVLSIALGSAFILFQYRMTKPDRNRRYFALGGILIVLGFVTFSPAIIRSEQKYEADRAIDPSATSKSGPSSSTKQSTSTSPPPSGTVVPADTGCPLPDPTDPKLPPIEIKVVYWCKGEVFEPDGTLDNQNYQIKVRPRLLNNTNQVLSISINSPSHIRLLISGSQIDRRWSPPPKTRQLGDRPILVKCNGGKYWGVPPNTPHDATPTAGGYYSGFVTSWTYSNRLHPGEVAFSPLRTRPDGTAIQEGNLVFQVPLNERHNALIYGLAVIDPDQANKVLGVALFDEPEQWGQALHPSEF